ncbi:MAG: serine/threonine-protein kinase [Acidobacteria bacterium]|nr:serine/threonine-protein kinase [Acidobacteriota bacterium]
MLEIAHYRILSQIGEGGMGAVYRATDTKLARDVAIKVLPDAYARDPDRLARFLREAQALASLNHPHIAAIYGIEERAIIMELVEGPTLADRIARGPLPVEETLAIAQQIAEALEAAHEKGIIHRDLKPANVKVTPDGNVKVLDFGLAKLADLRESSDPASAPTIVRGNSPTLAGVILGTAGYMAPEQARGATVDKRADIWAFGVVLYEMLSGRPLFDSGSIAEAIADVLRADIDLSVLPEATPAEVRKLVQRCLDRDSRSRLRDIGEARLVLAGPFEAPAVQAAETLGVQRRSVLPWLVGAVLAAGVPAAWFLKPQRDLPLMQLEIMPPQGVSMGPTGWGQLQISPDGSMIVFQARDRDGKEKLFLRTLSSGSTIALAGTDNGKLPYWSPDNHQIAFLADGRLRRLELAGNRVVDICDAATGVYLMWHGDGNIYVSTAEHVLRKVRASGGTLSAVFSEPQHKDTAGASPATIAGENTFLYQLFSGSSSKIIQVAGDGRVRKTLLPAGEASGAPASFARDSAGKGWLLFHTNFRLTAMRFDPRKGGLSGDPAIIAYDLPNGPSWSASNNGILAYRKRAWGSDRRLTWVDRRGVPGAAVSEQGNVFTPRISADEKAVAFNRNDANGGVYVYDVVRQTTTRAVSESGRSGYPIWMPGNDALVYRVLRKGVMLQGVRGTGGERLIHKNDDSRPTAASPDGKWVLSSEIRAGTPRMVALSVDGSNVLRLSQDPTHHASLSPDAQWLLYSALVNGRWDVFVRRAPPEISGKAGGSGGSSQLQISANGGLQPMWRADGKEIFYVAPSGILTAVPVNITGSGVQLGVPESLFPTTLGISATFQREYDASADGKRFLLPLQAAGTQGEVPITVIVNWPKLIEGK